MKVYKSFLVALCAFAFLACSQMASTPSPSDVLKTQFEAQKKKDVATMKQNLSKASLDILEKAGKAQGKTLDETLAVETPAGALDNYEVKNEKISGDTATVEVKLPSSDKTDTMPFVKEDGKWKIALDKYMQDLMKQMSQQAPPPAAPPSAAENSNATTGNTATNSNTATKAPAANK